MRSSRDSLSASRSNFIQPAVLVLALSVATEYMFADVVFADDAAKLGTIEVTGYRIKRTDLEGPSPVLSIDREAIENSGANTVVELLEKLPGASVTSESFALTDAPGAASINLKGGRKESEIQ